MPFLELDPDDTFHLRRGEVAICIPVYGAYDLFAQCLRSVLSHTPPEVAVLVYDDGNADPRFETLVRESAQTDPGGRGIGYVRQPENVGFVANVNAAMRAVAPGDLVILNSDCIVAEGWFEGMREAAYSESRIATATALTNAGTIVSVPHRNRPVRKLPEHLTAERAAADVRRASLRLRPDIPTCVGHCVYIRRSAIDLVGEFDTAFSPGYEEEVDFSQRCILRGLRHVVADDVFVFHRHAGSFGDGEVVTGRRATHHAIIKQRYPYYDDWIAEVATDRRSPLAHALTIAEIALRGLRVAIDGRCLGPTVTGTQLTVLGVAGALDSYTDAQVRILVPDDLGAFASDFLGGRPSIRVVRRADLEAGLEPADVAHRPYQVTSAEDLRLLRRLGDRVVVSQLDNIALRNPGYFDSYREWRTYRELAASMLAAADQVVFISRHGARDALELGLVDAERVNLVPPATEQDVLGLVSEAAPPPGAHRLEGRPFLLLLGTDFRHKNRVFAFRLLEALRTQGSFDGVLALAGPTVASGSSAGEESAWLMAHPDTAARVIDFGAVDEPGKRWLLEGAVAVLYPTTYEGFGLMPFEAGEAGTPCLFAAHTSLAEILPGEAALLVPWDAEESARRVAPVLTAGPARDELVNTLRLAGARFTNRSVASALMRTYERAVRSPPRTGGAGEDLDRLWTEINQLRQLVGEIYDDPLNRGLAGRYAVLDPELRRPVLAIATRQPLRNTALALYRAAHALRQATGERANRPKEEEADD